MLKSEHEAEKAALVFLQQSFFAGNLPGRVAVLDRLSAAEPRPGDVAEPSAAIAGDPTPCGCSPFGEPCGNFN